MFRTMSKAEERALEAYPNVEQKIYHGVFGTIKFDRNAEKREGFIKGYQQAEKDLELGWEDVRIILDAENDILRECNSRKELVIETYPKGEDYYGEILKRFRDYKERKDK